MSMSALSSWHLTTNIRRQFQGEQDIREILERNFKQKVLFSVAYKVNGQCYIYLFNRHGVAVAVLQTAL